MTTKYVKHIGGEIRVLDTELHVDRFQEILESITNKAVILAEENKGKVFFEGVELTPDDLDLVEEALELLMEADEHAVALQDALEGAVEALSEAFAMELVNVGKDIQILVADPLIQKIDSINDIFEAQLDKLTAIMGDEESCEMGDEGCVDSEDGTEYDDSEDYID